MAASSADGLGHAADVNGDGYADFLIGSPNYTDSRLFQGAVRAYYGSGPQPAAVKQQPICCPTAGDADADGVPALPLQELQGDIQDRGSSEEGGVSDASSGRAE